MKDSKCGSYEKKGRRRLVVCDSFVWQSSGKGLGIRFHPMTVGKSHQKMTASKEYVMNNEGYS